MRESWPSCWRTAKSWRWTIRLRWSAPGFGWPSLAIAVSFAADHLRRGAVSNHSGQRSVHPGNGTLLRRLGAWLLMREGVSFRTCIAIALALMSSPCCSFIFARGRLSRNNTVEAKMAYRKQCSKHH
jgi:hypothetical protein